MPFMRKQPIIFLLCAAAPALLATGCAGLKNLAPRKPTANVSGMHLNGISFQGLALVFDLKIENPNPFGISLAGFDYAFFLNNNRFLAGEQTETQNIQANGSSVVQFPISLNFSDLYSTYQGLKQADSVDYKIDIGFAFDLPVLGPVRVPVSRTGRIILPHPPRIALGGIKLRKLGLTGAELDLNLVFENPNAFSARLEKLNYRLSLSGKPIASGTSRQPMLLTQKGENSLTIPVFLNFAQAGRVLYRLLAQKQPLTYKLAGNLDLSAPAVKIARLSLPFQHAGQTRINR